MASRLVLIGLPPPHAVVLVGVTLTAVSALRTAPLSKAETLKLKADPYQIVFVVPAMVS